ncbi:MAG: response regulator, partial [Deltaproteobacteria bacterium]|nr:response regulator [Deltaproteobacteria bacterium]
MLFNQQSPIANPKPPRLLVVDDDEQIRRMLDRMLARDGYAVTLAADGTQARKCLEKQAFDLVLCDVNMPGESGIDLSRHIATRYADTAIIHITGVDDPYVADSAIEAGTFGYIIKPFNPNEVMINIRNALRRRGLEIANRNYREALEQMVEERTVRLREAMEGIIRAMSLTVESRDPYTS